MTAPQVSVIMPCYNAGKYVAEAVQSVLDQTEADLELIAVDDHSTDNTLEVLQSLAADPRVRVVPLPENVGQAAAANRGWQLARGRFIKFFDADDIMAPRMVEQQQQRLEGRDDCVASAEWGRFHGDEVGTYRANPQSVWRDMDAREWLVESWMGARPMMQCGLWLIPRGLLEKTGGWDERLSLINDFEFFARVLCAAREVLFTPDCPMHYRSGVAGSLSGAKGKKAVESAYLSTTLGVEQLLAKRRDDRARQACANMLQDFLFTYYPACPELLDKIEAKLAELPAPTVRPAGGRGFRLAAALLGWRTARRLQMASGKYPDYSRSTH
jgi:hypothetical protein